MEYCIDTHPEVQAGKQINNFLKEHKDVPVLLMFSGGSAFSVFEHVDAEYVDERITMSVIDDRFSMDPLVNNFTQFEQTDFFDKLLEKQVSIIGTKIYKGESLPRAVQHYEMQLRMWRKRNPEGIVCAILGMGDDGHTAGIFPFPESEKCFNDLFLDDEWVVGYDAKGKNQHSIRFTVTLSFLLQEVEYAIAFACGEQKHLMLKKIKGEKLPYHVMPAQVWKDMKKVTLCTDLEL